MFVKTFIHCRESNLDINATMKQNNTPALSFFVMIFIMVLIIIGHFTQPKLKQDFLSHPNWVMMSPPITCIPMTFIYHDPGVREQSNHWFDFSQNTSHLLLFIKRWNYPTEGGFPFHTLAYAYTPLFFWLDIWGKSSSFPADGFLFHISLPLRQGYFLFVGWLDLFLRRFPFSFFRSDDRHCHFDHCFSNKLFCWSHRQLPAATCDAVQWLCAVAIFDV